MKPYTPPESRTTYIFTLRSYDFLVPSKDRLLDLQVSPFASSCMYLITIVTMWGIVGLTVRTE